MEMNTRLQVEHPVTEEVTGLDLVELQLRVAAGEPLPLVQDDVSLRGHAVEVRVYAEDPATGFLPTGGRVLALREPRGLPGIRVDSGIAEGTVVGSDYDPLLSKIIAYGADRAEALQRLDAALGRTVLLGLGTNVAFLRALLADPDVRAGNLDTGLVGRRIAELGAADLPDDVVGVATGVALLDLEPRGADRRPVRRAGRVAPRRAGLDHPPGASLTGTSRWRSVPGAAPPTPSWSSPAGRPSGPAPRPITCTPRTA